MNNTMQLYIDEKKEIKGYPITSPDRVIDENGVSIKEQLDKIENEFDKAVANVTNGNESVTNSEIVQARGKEVNLNTRLNKIDDDIDFLTDYQMGNAVIYGVEVDFENFTFTRTNNAIGLTATNFNNIAPWRDIKRCNVANGVVTAYYGDSNFAWNGSNGNVMVEIPKFYYKVVPLNLKSIQGGEGHHILKARWLISSIPYPSFKVHPAFIRNGVEKDYIYVGAFEGSIWDKSFGSYLIEDEQVADFDNDRLSSIAGAKPCSGKTQELTIVNSRKLCANNGTGYKQIDFTTISALQILHLVEYASFDTQTTIGRGVVDLTDVTGENCSLKTSSTATLGNVSGMATGTNGQVSISYRGIENLWGNIWSFVDGINIEDNSKNIAYWSNDDMTSNTSANHKKISFTLAKTNGYVSKFGYDKENDFVFLASESLGVHNKPANDYYWQNNTYAGWSILRYGGMWNSAVIAGGYCFYTDYTSLSKSRSNGSRLMFVK